jgi:hypothetical protein
MRYDAGSVDAGCTRRTVRGWTTATRGARPPRHSGLLTVSSSMPHLHDAWWHGGMVLVVARHIPTSRSEIQPAEQTENPLLRWDLTLWVIVAGAVYPK